jgi:hypothetical protein
LKEFEMALSFKYSTSGGFKLSGSADNLSNILHYYKFDNGTLDSFGFFDLIGTNQYQAGIINQAVLTSKFSKVEGNASINGAFYSGNSFTFTMWFKIGTTTKNQNIFKLKSPDQDLVIFYDKTTKKIYFNTLSNPISATLLSGAIWYFVCVKKLGSIVYVQLNNQSAVSYPYNYSPIRFNSVDATDLDVIALSKYSALYWDEVRFYYSFLTSKEITYVYNNGKPKAITGGDQALLWSLPTHYYSFDNFVSDEAGNANLSLTQYSVSGGTSAIVPGKFNNALQIGNTYSLNSSLGHDYYGYTSYDNNILGSAGDSYSISFWSKRLATPLNEITTQVSLMSILTASDDNILQFGYNNKNIFKVDDGTINGSALEVSSVLTNWNHFAIIYNAEQGRYTFFLNGKIYGEISVTRSNSTAAKFYLGWDGTTYLSGTPYLCQVALIEDLRIYNSYLSGWDIYAIYAGGLFSDFEKSLNINFNLGTPSLKAYQVESYDFYEDDPNVEIEIPNPQHKLRTSVQQIWARSVNEVCQILKSVRYIPNIKSISEWSNDLIGPYGGGDPVRDQYGSYVKITNFCDNADCVDFCLSVNATVNISAIAFASSTANQIEGLGSVEMAGTATVFANKNKYIGDGSFELVGNAPASQIGGIDGTAYTAAGGFELTGSAVVNSSDKGTLLVETGGTMEISSVTPLLKSSTGSNLTGSAISSRENICDCKNVPYQIQLKHNLTKTSELTRFATRNDLSIPSIVSMVYNEKIGQYVGNIRLDGLSSFANAKEYWYITFNLYCTGELNQFSNRYNWILNTSIRRSTVGFVDKETSIIIYLLSSYICPQFDASKFRFSINVNLNTLVTTINNSSFINSSNVNDRIGLFLSDAWIASPNFVVSVGV